MQLFTAAAGYNFAAQDKQPVDKAQIGKDQAACGDCANEPAARLVLPLQHWYEDLGEADVSAGALNDKV